MNFFLIFFLFCIALQSCVSLNKNMIEARADSSQKVTTNFFKIHFLTRKIGDRTCFNEEQIDFLKETFAKHFYKKNTENGFFVVFTRNSNSEQFILSLNAILSIATYSIVPMYKSEDYKIEVYTNNNQYVSKQYNDESLYTLLALPFMFSNNLNDIRRNNIENLIYQASLQDTSKSEFVSNDFEDLKICSGFRDSFVEQRW